MALKAITVNTPAEQEGHIYSQDDAAIYESIFGSDGVFNIGNKFKATVLNNNSIRVSDGVLCVGGHVARTLYADYQDMVIQNGASGYKRNDIIYAKFITSGNSDALTLEVKKGTPVTGTASDPAMTKGNLYQGAALREYPLWRVKLDGLSVTAVEQLFQVIPTIPELEGEIGALNTKLGKIMNITTTSKILKSNIWDSINSVQLEPGIWLVCATYSFENNSIGDRMVSIFDVWGQACINANKSGDTTITIPKILNSPNEKLTCNFYAKHNSGSSLSCQVTGSAIRFK